MKNLLKSVLAIAFLVAVILVNFNHQAVSSGPVGVCCDFYPDETCVHPNDPEQEVFLKSKWFPGRSLCPVPPPVG